MPVKYIASLIGLWTQVQPSLGCSSHTYRPPSTCVGHHHHHHQRTCYMLCRHTWIYTSVYMYICRFWAISMNNPELLFLFRCINTHRRVSNALDVQSVIQMQIMVMGGGGGGRDFTPSESKIIF